MRRSARCWRWRMRWSAVVDAANMIMTSVRRRDHLTPGTESRVSVSAEIRVSRDSVWSLLPNSGTHHHAPASVNIKNHVTLDSSSTLIPVSVNPQPPSLMLWRLEQWSEKTETMRGRAPSMNTSSRTGLR